MSLLFLFTSKPNKREMIAMLTDTTKRNIVMRSCDALCALQSEVNRISFEANRQIDNIITLETEPYPSTHAAEFKTHLYTRILWMRERSYQTSLPLLLDCKTKNEEEEGPPPKRECMNDFIREVKEMQRALSADIIKSGYREFVDRQISEALIDIIMRKLGLDCTVPVGSKEHVAMLDPVKISQAGTEVEALQKLVECQSFLNQYLVACE